MSTLHCVLVHAPDDPILAKVLALSNQIFSPDPASKYGSLSTWTQRLAPADAVVIYLAPGDERDAPVAFLFAHPRVHDPPLQDGSKESLHIWLAGVLPERRKEGCLTTMVRALETTLPLTICTTRSLYPDMWDWLAKREWRLERELEGGKEMFSLSRRFLRF